jgi:excisionase family DNA binding protein
MTSEASNFARPKLRTGQAAVYTGLAKSTLEKLRVHGGGCPYMRVGRVVVYDPDDLDAWLASHKRTCTSDAQPCSAVETAANRPTAQGHPRHHQHLKS